MGGLRSDAARSMTTAARAVVVRQALSYLPHPRDQLDGLAARDRGKPSLALPTRLIHSDGCRFTNPVRHPKKTYRYTRYTFCNHSDDIRGLFCEACDMVGVEWRRMNRWNISVARRDSVALMDRYIGPKC
jgi:hypothetical protein